MGSPQFAKLGVEVNRRVGAVRAETFALSNVGTSYMQLGDLALVSMTLAEVEMALGRSAASADALDRCDAIAGFDARSAVRMRLLEFRIRLALA